MCSVHPGFIAMGGSGYRRRTVTLIHASGSVICKRVVFPSGAQVMFGLTIAPWIIQKKQGLNAGFADGVRLQRSGGL